MNNTIHDQLNKLRIISKIKEGNSLTTNPQLEIYTPGYFSWIFRKIHQDSKDEVIKYLQEFYRAVDQSVEQIIGEITCKRDRKRSIMIATSLSDKIHISIYGLEHLVKTYHKYPTTVSVIEGIIQDYALVSYKKLIDTVPIEYHTDIMNTSIRYLGEVIFQSNKDKLEENKIKQSTPIPCPISSFNAADSNYSSPTLSAQGSPIIQPTIPSDTPLNAPLSMPLNAPLNMPLNAPLSMPPNAPLNIPLEELD